MILYEDEEINVLNKKRIYLIDKINAYFKRVVKYKHNPIITKKVLIRDFNKLGLSMVIGAIGSKCE